MTNNRPLSITLISLYLIFSNIIQVFLLMALHNNGNTTSFQLIFGLLNAVLFAACGFLILIRQSWARILYIVLFGINVIYQVSIMGANGFDSLIIQLPIFIVIIYFLFNGKASQYFSDGTNDSQALNIDVEQLSLRLKLKSQLAIGIFLIVYVAFEQLKPQRGLSVFGYDSGVSRAFNDVGIPWSIASFIGQYATIALFVTGCILIVVASKKLKLIKKSVEM